MSNCDLSKYAMLVDKQKKGTNIKLENEKK